MSPLCGPHLSYFQLTVYRYSIFISKLVRHLLHPLSMLYSNENSIADYLLSCVFAALRHIFRGRYLSFQRNQPKTRELIFHFLLSRRGLNSETFSTESTVFPSKPSYLLWSFLPYGKINIIENNDVLYGLDKYGLFHSN